MNTVQQKILLVGVRDKARGSMMARLFFIDQGEDRYDESFIIKCYYSNLKFNIPLLIVFYWPNLVK